MNKIEFLNKDYNYNDFVLQSKRKYIKNGMITQTRHCKRLTEFYPEEDGTSWYCEKDYDCKYLKKKDYSCLYCIISSFLCILSIFGFMYIFYFIQQLGY
jgi:hypothetical protein